MMGTASTLVLAGCVLTKCHCPFAGLHTRKCISANHTSKILLCFNGKFFFSSSSGENVFQMGGSSWRTGHTGRSHNHEEPHPSGTDSAPSPRPPNSLPEQSPRRKPTAHSMKSALPHCSPFHVPGLRCSIRQHSLHVAI